MTPSFESQGLISRKDERNSVSLMLPVAPWMRQQLDKLENYVQTHVTIPATCDVTHSGVLYKPLWSRDKMFISVSRWCQLFIMNDETQAYERADVSQTKFVPGTYFVSVEAPYIYMGPHKQGETYSLTLRVVQILYQPKLETQTNDKNDSKSLFSKPLLPKRIADTNTDCKSVFSKPVETKGRKKKKNVEVSSQLPSAMDTA